MKIDPKSVNEFILQQCDIAEHLGAKKFEYKKGECLIFLDGEGNEVMRINFQH